MMLESIGSEIDTLIADHKRAIADLESQADCMREERFEPGQEVRFERGGEIISGEIVGWQKIGKGIGILVDGGNFYAGPSVAILVGSKDWAKGQPIAFKPTSLRNAIAKAKESRR